MTYIIVEEASGAIVENTSDLQGAIEDAKSFGGKHLVIEDSIDGKIVFDTQPGVTYKI